MGGGGALSRLILEAVRRPHYLAGMTLSIVLWAYFNSVIPVFVKGAIDEGLVAGSSSALIHYSLLILLFLVFSGLSSFASRYLAFRLSQDIVYMLRLRAFRAILYRPMDYFDGVSVGQVISRITNDAEKITRFIAWRTRMIIYSVTALAASLYIMYSMSPRLSLAGFLAVAAFIAVNTRYASIIRPVYDEIRHRTGVLAGIASNGIAGIKTVKSMALEPQVYGMFMEENEKLLSAGLRAARIRAVYGNAPILVTAAAMTAILYYGGYAIEAGYLTLGELAAFLIYMLRLMWPLRALGFSVADIQRSAAAAKRLYELIGLGEEGWGGELEIRDARGELVFEDVWFTYPGGKEPALRGISLRVRPGEKIVVVGPPGSGKSTLLKLAAGLYREYRGRILLDGVEIRRIRWSSLRRLIVYVPQEPFIFNRSIRENIELGRPGAAVKEIVWAAETARIHGFVEKLPRGYDTVVGERGVALSGGQRQRIGLARALLADPIVLLLDDPVSNLDAETERELVERLRRVLRGKTVLIATQRFSLVDLADRIIVMDSGRIVEEGRHSELMERRGLYYRLYMSSERGE